MAVAFSVSMKFRAVACILALTAAFSASSYARAASYEAESFEKLLTHPGVTASMREHMKSIHVRTGIYPLFQDWSIEQNRAHLERALAKLDSPAFFAAFPHLQKSCSISGRALYFNTYYMIIGESLTVKQSDPNLLAWVEKLPGECEKIDASLKSMEQLSGRKFKIDLDRVVSGEARAQALVAWERELKSNKLTAALLEYERSCVAELKQVRLDRFNSYSNGDKQLTLTFKGGPLAAARKLLSTASTCAKVIPVVQSFNAKHGMDHGLVFSIEPDMLQDRNVKPSQVSAWLKYFNADPSRLDALKNHILAASRPWDYREHKQCLSTPGKTPYDCRNPLIAINMSIYNDISSLTGITSVVLFFGDTVNATLLMAHGMTIKGKTVNVDVTATPTSTPAFK